MTTGETRESRETKERRGRLTRGQRWTLGLFVLFLLVPAGYGFAAKLVQFVVTISEGGEGAFTIVPLMTYFIVSVGMICLLVWGIANGMFRNIEGPKYTMLERERWLDENGKAQEQE